MVESIIYKVISFGIFCSLSLTGYSNILHPDNQDRHSDSTEVVNLEEELTYFNEDHNYDYYINIDCKIDSIIDLGEKYLGKPYRSVINNGMVLDCSGFINHIYKENGIELPRVSRTIGEVVDKIDLSEVRRGDLLFFKPRNRNSNTIGHVAMVYDVIDDEIIMMHSCNSGIRIEPYNNNTYYTSRILLAGRLPQLEFEIDLSENESQEILEQEDEIQESFNN